MKGETISHYRILDELGRGGMGVVYLAEDARLGRRVALKFLPLDAARNDEVTQRFIHEARTASALDHPNVCTIYDTGESPDGRLFIAMACYDGETLEQRLRRGCLDVGEALDAGTGIGRRAPGIARPGRPRARFPKNSAPRAQKEPIVPWLPIASDEPAGMVPTSS